jgi:hypothetical protein
MKFSVRSLALAGVLALMACTRENPAFEGADAGHDEMDAGPPVDEAKTGSAADAWGPEDTARPGADAAGGLADAAAIIDAGGPADAGAPDAPLSIDADTVAGGARYSFETSLQGWTDLRYQFYGVSETVLARSTAHAFEGTYALAIPMDTTTTKTSMPTIGVSQHFTDLPAGTVITYHLWLPAGAPLTYVQPYVLYYRGNTGQPVWGGIDPPLFPANLKLGGWNTITHRVPSDVDARGVLEVGMEFQLAGQQKLTVYLDAVDW